MYQSGLREKKIGMAVRDQLPCLDHSSLWGHPVLEDVENPLDFVSTLTTADEDQVRLLLQYTEEHVQEYGRDSEQFRLAHSVILLAEEVGDRSVAAQDLSLVHLLSSNCIAVREAAALASLFELVSLCDTFIRSNFSKMLNEREMLSLPRVQVHVNVCDNSEDLWSADTCVLDRVLPAVIRLLQGQCRNGQVMEEKVMVMDLLSDLSVEMTEGKKSISNYLSPERPMSNYINLSKKQPSPARKLHLGSSQECADEDDVYSKQKNWAVVASKNVSCSAAICVVSRSFPDGLVVLNIQLVSKDIICPISPTTGVPLSTGSTLLSQMTQPRSGFGLVAVGDSMISVGGFNRSGVLPDVEWFNGGVNSWSLCGRLSCKRARMSVVKLKDTLYAIGGSDGKSELNSMEEHQLSSSGKEWKVLHARLSTPRSDFGAATLGDKIYVVGGTYYSSVLRSGEVYDTKEHRWRPIAPMTVPRKGASVVACNGKIFALGGQRLSWNCLSTVESYDPSTNQWIQVTPMAIARRNASAVTVEGRIYVVGGYNGLRAVETMEVYDPVSNEWSFCKPMTLGRSGASAVLMGEMVCVVGGFTGSSFLNSIEKYDLESEQWTSFIA